MKYCKVGKRFTAYLVDVLVQILLVGLVAFVLEQQTYVGLLSSGILLVSLSWLYFAIMESSKYQATVGKLLLGVKVVDLKGKRISFLKATGRYLGKFLSRLLLGFGFIMMLFTKKKQCLHDKLTKTLVVKN
jgi:uncharacterized RDD family membrane protein YckC